jgi:lipopolysaccharide export system permease protein
VIVNRYIQRSIHLGTLGALMLLVSLSLFFTFVRELDNLGENGYGILQLLEYLALRAPGNIIEFLPLSVLLGSMLSLGALANNSELIAMQASGVTLQRLLGAMLQASLVIALLGFLVADWVVPDSEINARKIKNMSRQEASNVLDSKQGLWIKDESRVVHVQDMLPNGYARDIEIFELDASGNPQSMIRAESAEPVNGGWELHRVSQTTIVEGKAGSRMFEKLKYPGNLSLQLLQVLTVEPRQMSSRDLMAYLQFLDENRLDAKVERLIFWQKMFSPITIVIMCLLAFPFVMGAQRLSNTGQRLLIGILLGLSFAVIDRVLTQLGIQYDISAFAVALAPNFLFLVLALYLVIGKQSLGAGFKLFIARRRG